MPASSERRSAARTATLVAIPVALLAGLLSFWVLGGFDRTEPSPSAPSPSAPSPSAPSPGAQATGPVSMPAPSLPPAVAGTCRSLVAALPDAIRDARRRPVTAGPEQNAAYGDPPVTLACGTEPASIPTGDRVFVLSGVCWFARPDTDRTVWTTVDRVVPVTVTVPGGQEASAQSVIPFSAAIGGTDPLIDNPPTGC
jgi:hypothetical protein